MGKRSLTNTYTDRKELFTKRKCLTAVWTYKKFDRYITGLDKLQLLTSHKPLVILKNMQELNNTLFRYNTVAEPIPGKLIIVPGTLSHNPISVEDSSTVEELCRDSIREKTLRNPKCYTCR